MDRKNNTVIELKNISKSFQDNLVLEKINLELEGGRFYVLLGENGSGKSTLIRIMMGVEGFDQGEGKILGHNIKSDDLAIKQKIGIVSESLEFDVNISMKEFFKHYSLFYPNWDQKLFEKIVSDRNVDLNKKFKNFSRGQKMQIGLIAALAIRPAIIFIDEVTSVLDIYARQYFMNLLHAFYQEGTTIILTTNIISEVSPYATDVLLLKKGHIEFNLPIKKIPENFIKLKRPNGVEESIHPVFVHHECVPVGQNEDYSISFIVPRLVADNYEKEFKINQEFYDTKKTGLEDIFIFYTQNNSMETQSSKDKRRATK